MSSESKIVLALVALVAVIVVGALTLLGFGRDVPPEVLALAATAVGGVLGYLTRGRVDEVRRVIDEAPTFEDH